MCSTSCLGQEFRCGAMLHTKRQSDDNYCDIGNELHILVHIEEVSDHKKLFFHIILRIRYYMEPLEDLCCCS